MPYRIRRRGRRSLHGRRSLTFEDFLKNYRKTLSYGGRQGPIEDQSDDEDAPDPEDLTTIQVTNVDLQIGSNTRAHRTAEFDITDASANDNQAFLVVRRGQAFHINIAFNRAYDDKKDDIRLVFQFGKTPIPSKGTQVEFILSAKDKPNEWGAMTTGKTDNSINLKVTTPASCFIGKWRLKLDVVKRGDSGIVVYRYEHKDPFYMLFNPWCNDDDVYMKEESLLDEYVLNDTGKIYYGSYKSVSPRPWVFGQFTGDILDCCVYLLDNAKIPDHSRGNVVLIARKISAMVNEADDSGVLVGNWSGDYSDGVSPLSWTGSVAILDKFYKTKEPVEYGQCWVFSGIVTTVCRALGIPARSVTNFSSAHDTDGSITIDNHFGPDNKPKDEYDDDSIWNFHVWNDVWMARPDLPSGYGGWQAIDATPQETSDGIYCMGPMSIAAIKAGEVNLPYDGRFVFAEVNADRVLWRIEEDTSVKPVRILKHSVGRVISTKAPKGVWPAHENITQQYKYPEYSDEERAAVMRANLFSTKKGLYEPGAEDVKFELTVDPDTHMGDDVTVLLKMTNTSGSSRTVDGTLVVDSMYYTGVLYKTMTAQEFATQKIEAGKDKTVKVVVSTNDYMDKLMDHCICKISCMCLVKETKQTFADLEELRLRKPHLTIKAPDTGDVGKTFSVEVSFTNPLPSVLSKCELRVEGPGLQKPTVYKQPNVNPKQTFVANFDMKPAKIGKREIVVYFNSTQLSSVNGTHEITVK